MVAVIHTDPEGCHLEVTSLGQRAGTDSETASLVEAIGKQLEFLKEEKEGGRQRVQDFDLVVNEVSLVLETTLRASLRISLAIEALNILNMWVGLFGSRDVSAIISCVRTTLAELRVDFL